MKKADPNTESKLKIYTCFARLDIFFTGNMWVLH